MRGCGEPEPDFGWMVALRANEAETVSGEKRVVEKSVRVGGVVRRPGNVGLGESVMYELGSPANCANGDSDVVFESSLTV